MTEPASTDITIPYDIVIEVGAFCAGGLQFQSLLSVALTCHAVYDELKPTLDRKIMVFDRDTVKTVWKIAVDKENGPAPESWRQVEYLIVHAIDNISNPDFVFAACIRGEMLKLFPRLVALMSLVKWTVDTEVVREISFLRYAPLDVCFNIMGPFRSCAQVDPKVLLCDIAIETFEKDHQITPLLEELCRFYASQPVTPSELVTVCSVRFSDRSTRKRCDFVDIVYDPTFSSILERFRLRAIGAKSGVGFDWPYRYC
ncbi:hypothetical protein QFC22_006605 [Naganishia vaughanmartiniae]|uniref:Uncharacterized protein n=1 Tax=Naganishia vaughanmartiniae TaxID=1424756 RepID=A0ACC2WIR4_9TREE|nr:hypothetical protein QFC22_006605 [Naganishia vaughanmartiniae]